MTLRWGLVLHPGVESCEESLVLPGKVDLLVVSENLFCHGRGCGETMAYWNMKGVAYKVIPPS